MDITLRPEAPADELAVEGLTREAFWNKYKPGCDEHLVLHQLRLSPAFVPELSILAEVEGQLVGHIAYARGSLTEPSGREHIAIGFGPISVAPARQRQGIGGRLIQATLTMAADAGYPAVFITGDPGYYHRFGFVTAGDLGFRLDGVSSDDPAPWFMVRILDPAAMAGISGIWRFDPAYEVDPEDLAVFDSHFPPREKLVLPGQIFSQQGQGSAGGHAAAQQLSRCGSETDRSDASRQYG